MNKPLKLSRALAVAAGFTVAFSASAEDAYIQSDGSQHIRTWVYASPTTKIVIDFAYTSATPTQQRIFGADDDGSTAGLSFSSYINGNGYYAWACQNNAGNWQSTGVKADTTRRTLTLDSNNNRVTLDPGGYSATFNTTRTKTSIWPLALFTCNKSTDYSKLSNYGKAKLYSCRIYDNGCLIRNYLPYKSADGATIGLKELVSGEIVKQASGNAFTAGGDISDSPTWDDPTIRQTERGTEYLFSCAQAEGGTVSAQTNGVDVAEASFWVAESDVVTVTATADAGNRFLYWTGKTASFAADSYAGDATVTLHPKCPTSLTPTFQKNVKTRSWKSTTKTDGQYYWKTAENWLDENGETGKPTVGDTVLFTDATGSGPYHVSEDGSGNPLYEIRFEGNNKYGSNQGSFALLAGGKGLQYLRNANCNDHWSGLRLIGDGLVPVNIANNVTFPMQKACLLGTKSGFRQTPTVVKQGKGTFINCNESGNYSYTVPTTLIQEGRWDLTLTTTIDGCVFGFDGPAEKKLTFCYKSYTTDIKIKNGGFFEVNGAKNHVIGANNNTAGRVVFTGTPKYNPMVFSGKFTAGAGLVWSPNAAGYVFVCSNAVSDTKGQLSVTKGEVRLVNGASFTALGELAVSGGALLTVEAGSGADFAASKLTLGDTTAKLKLGAGVTLAIGSATANGVALSAGTYAAAAGDGVKKASWIEGAGTVTVSEGPENSDTWSGGDSESTLVTRDGNWASGTAPDLSSGTLLATFATGGSEAHLATSAAFNGLVLNNIASGTTFAFTAEPGAVATVNATAISIPDAASARTWNMGWPIALGANQTWSIGANNTLRLAGGLSGASDLTVNNSGTLELAGESTQSGALSIKGGTVKVSASNAFGSKDRTVAMNHLTTKYVFSGDITLDAPMYSSDLSESTASCFSFEPNSHVTFNGNFGYKADGGLTFGEGSKTVFAGGMRFNTDGMKGMAVLYGSGTVVITNKTINPCRRLTINTKDNVTLELWSKGNNLNDTTYWARIWGGRLVTRVENALNGYNSYLLLQNTTFDLDGHDQRIGLLGSAGSATVTSEKTALLTVTSAASGLNQDDWVEGVDETTNRVDKAVFAGQVSFRKEGAYPHIFGAVSSSTGALEVTKGVLKMNANGQWPNATEVRVAGGAVVAENAGGFGTNATWRVTTGAEPVVRLDYEGTGTCKRVYVDGRRVAGAVYGAKGSGAEREVDWISGTGYLKSEIHGLVLYLK